MNENYFHVYSDNFLQLLLGFSKRILGTNYGICDSHRYTTTNTDIIFTLSHNSMYDVHVMLCGDFMELSQ